MSTVAVDPPAATRSQQTTADELLGMGEGRRELIRGEVVELTPTGWWHAEIANEIAFHISAFVKERGLGHVATTEAGFLLEENPDTVGAPDVAFMVSGRQRPKSGFVRGAPDLAVEVISSRDSYSEVRRKVRGWLEHGAQQVWVVDPQREVVELFAADGAMRLCEADDVIDGGDLLPGFSLPVRDCFPE